jgi:hypothetical protein
MRKLANFSPNSFQGTDERRTLRANGDTFKIARIAPEVKLKEKAKQRHWLSEKSIQST